LKAPIPSNGTARLATPREYRILETGSEQAFDDISALASSICGCPIALVSIVDEKRARFTSRAGPDVTETPRELAFCAYTVLGQAVNEFRHSHIREDGVACIAVEPANRGGGVQQAREAMALLLDVVLDAAA
jgi:hypothetical protein